MRVTRPGTVVSESGTPAGASRPKDSQVGRGDSVTLSSVGLLATELRARAAGTGEVRPDVVARMRAEIAAGTLGSPEDLDLAVEGLLRGL